MSTTPGNHWEKKHKEQNEWQGPCWMRITSRRKEKTDKEAMTEAKVLKKKWNRKNQRERQFQWNKESKHT